VTKNPWVGGGGGPSLRIFKKSDKRMGDSTGVRSAGEFLKSCSKMPRGKKNAKKTPPCGRKTKKRTVFTGIARRG